MLDRRAARTSRGAWRGLRITAASIAEIVKTKFAPLDVVAAVDALLETSINMTSLYRGVMRVLGSMFANRSLPGSAKRVSSVAAILSQDPAFKDVTVPQVQRALELLATQSKGGLIVRKDVILFHSDFQEVTRLVSSLTGDIGDPRSLGTFKR